MQDFDRELSLEDIHKAHQRSLQRNNVKDYSGLRESLKDSWTQVLDGSTLPDFILSALKRFVLLPKADFQIPLLASYMSLPSAFCSEVPIAYSSGKSGSGKSAVGDLIGAMLECPPISFEGVTPASFRNSIREYTRWIDDEEPGEECPEKHGIIVLEDLGPDSLGKFDGAILGFLKNGVKRPGLSKIAGKDGKNLIFETFSPKYLSSIHPLYGRYEFRELKRRLYIVEHKPYGEWETEDHSNFYRGVEPDDLLNVDEVSFDGFYQEFTDYWDRKDIQTIWLEVAAEVKAYRKHKIDRPRWAISKNWLMTGLVCQYWPNIKVAAEHLREYWERAEKLAGDSSNAITKVLTTFIEVEAAAQEQNNKAYLSLGRPEECKPVMIDPAKLNKYLQSAQQKGELDGFLTPKSRADAMAQVGWKLELVDGGMKWVKM